MNAATLVTILVLTLAGLAQESRAAAPIDDRANDAPTVPTIPVKFTSELKIPSLMGVMGIEQPVRCGTDGRVFLRTASSIGMNNDVVMIMPSGSTTNFRTMSIMDVPNAYISRYFPTDNDLYALVRGFSYGTKTVRTKGQMPDGRTVETSGQAVSLQNYIVRFGLDGSYRGAVRLEIPFQPSQFGVFTSGDFIVSGRDNDSGEPKTALVRASGQFDRYIELRGDITGKSESVREQARSDNKGFVRGALQWMVDTTELIPDGDKLLLVRKLNQVTVFEIIPSGTVRRVLVKAGPADATLQSLKPAAGRWLVQFTKSSRDGLGVTVLSYYVDPETGRFLEKLVYSTPVGLGVACFHDGEFLAVRQNEEGEMILLKGTPDTRGSGTDQPEAE
ncbi:MAG TPA: hypothetical protein VN622_07085 [Clostridia bacterium]|nr:hypothetical protein [Clostridia bacterium]